MTFVYTFFSSFKNIKKIRKELHSMVHTPKANSYTLVSFRHTIPSRPPPLRPSAFSIQPINSFSVNFPDCVLSSILGRSQPFLNKIILCKISHLSGKGVWWRLGDQGYDWGHLSPPPPISLLFLVRLLTLPCGVLNFNRWSLVDLIAVTTHYFLVQLVP